MDRRALVRLTVANPASAVYLTAVGASIAVCVATPLLNETGDAGLVWVWPAFFTAPTSLVLARPLAATGTDVHMAGYVGWIAVSALVQSFALGSLYSYLRRGRPRRGARGMRTQ
ncbi:SCO4225 family membrane protein [Streptomyces sp. NPDC088387]|uniref:SCO4225 family membrane protein n=1 Tax=Streptomyces sp. NPDC088387 TaxID=3365859 RepID=UPI0038273E44